MFTELQKEKLLNMLTFSVPTLKNNKYKITVCDLVS